MNKKQILKLILIYAVLFIIGTVAYIASFHTPLLGFLNVFFYRGIALIVLWGILISIAMFVIKKKWMDDTIIYRDIILLFMCFCCINVVIFTHLPVTADRSVTVYTLGFMNNHPDETFTKEELEQQFISQYVIEYGAFDKRLEEQIVSGNIVEVAPGEYQITDGGRFLMDIYSATVEWYNLDDKLVNPN